MTEGEWLSFKAPESMLEHLRGQATERKLRLFACACCRRIWHLIGDERGRTAVEVAERYADNLTGAEELRAGWTAASGDDLPDDNPEESAHLAALTATFCACHNSNCLHRASSSASDAVFYTAYAVEGNEDLAYDAEEAESADQCRLIRDIFGNPFRLAKIDQSCLGWNDGTVPKLAQAIYDDRRFEDLPILADALEDAGCHNADILAHCRQPGEHVRGCWVVDLLLGKT